jgi:hypothetical protein
LEVAGTGRRAVLTALSPVGSDWLRDLREKGS